MKSIFQYFAFEFIVLIITAVLTCVMRKKHFKIRQRVSLPLIGFISSGLFAAGWMSDPVWVIRGVIFALILLYASVQDVTSREADDFLWVMMLILAVSNIGKIPVWSMILGAVAVLLPQLAVVVFAREGAIGGADIKLSTAAAVVLGFAQGAWGYMLGLFIAVLSTLIYRKVRHKIQNDSIPLVPYLSVGLMIGYMI